MRHPGIREQIRAEMLERARLHPLARPMSAKELQAGHPDWPLSTIYWHMDRIRAEAELEGWNSSNSSAAEPTLG